MSMFGGMKQLWSVTALTSAIEGVIRECARGNALEVQRWYFKLKKEAYKQSIKEGVSASIIENRALSMVNSEQSELYKGIVERLSQPGGALEEVNEWLEINTPV